MRMYYFFFLLITAYSALFSIPTAHVAFEQNQNHNLHDFFHYNKHAYHYSYQKKDNLFAYSSAQLQQHFENHGYSEKDILACNVLYMSDAFIQLTKTYSGYEKAVTKLYHKLKRAWCFQKTYNWLITGTYCPKLFKRVCRLHKELKQYQQVTTQKALSFADMYHINLINFFPYNGSSVAQQMYKNYITILERASNIADHNSIIRDSIGKASHIGLEANKQGYTKYAAKIADFCWLMLDCAAACDEGIYLGASHTLDAIIHPVETIKNSLVGVAMIAYGLSKLIAIPVECAFLYATDEHGFYLRTNAICDQLTAIARNIMQYVETTPPRDIVKQSSALLTEAVLLTKISSFAYDISKKLLPIACNCIEYVTKKEPVVCLAEGAVIKVDVPQNIQNKLSKNIAHFTKDDTSLVYEQIQHSAEALVPYAETGIEHAPAAISTKIEPGAQKLKPLGRGSTGRTIPNNLHEQLVMEEALSNPGQGFEIKIGNGMTDPRWHKSEGWIKMGWYNEQEDIAIHYVVQKINDTIVAIDDFKFKYTKPTV